VSFVMDHVADNLLNSAEDDHPFMKEEIMVNVQPWHSKRVNDREVYHDNGTCPEGTKIEIYNRAPGTGGRPRCEQCSRLIQRST
jgi:hypothetical protein